MDKPVKITLITGYLGSGKTTLVNHILKNQEGYKVAVIVNDIGEVNIDASLIENGGSSIVKDDIVPLTNGCICCTLKTQLTDQIAELALSKKFDYILIEASGICEPIPIAQTISMAEETYRSLDKPKLWTLDNVVCVTDAKRLHDEFDCGSKLMREDIDDDDIENLLIQQLEFCNTIILNKVDELTQEELNIVKSIIRKLQPEANIIETNYAKVEIKDVMDTSSFDFKKVSMSAGWSKALDEEEEEEPETEEYGISTFSYKEIRPFSLKKFKAFINNNFPETIIRSKGIIWFNETWDKAYMFEQAGQQITASEFGRWVGAAPKKEKERILKNNASARARWNEKYEDRFNQIVFIGQNMDKAKLKEELDKCLVTK